MADKADVKPYRNRTLDLSTLEGVYISALPGLLEPSALNE